MKVYNRYILALTLAFCIIDGLMLASGKHSLDAHFAVLVIASLVITLVFTHFSPRAKKMLNSISIAFFTGFLVIVALRIWDVLAEA